MDAFIAVGLYIFASGEVRIDNFPDVLSKKDCERVIAEQRANIENSGSVIAYSLECQPVTLTVIEQAKTKDGVKLPRGKKTSS